MTDPRIERSKNSLSALKERLKEVLDQPSGFIDRASLRAALKSQGALARYHEEGTDLVGTSLNTLKRLSSEVFEGGFAEVEGLRHLCVESIEKAERALKQGGRTTKTGLRETIRELEEQNRVLREDLFLLTALLTESMERARAYAAAADASTIDRCRREQRDTLVSLGLRRALEVGERRDSNEGNGR